MTEREDGFLRAVLELASVLGWRAFHPRPARTAQGWATAFSGDAGYVDLTLARSGSPIVFAELKVARRLGAGKTLVVIFPDSGERYFSAEPYFHSD